MKRFTLVEKSASEVGDGTEWPMLVTRDQLAEIMYRVRDAKFSGEATATYSALPPMSLKFTTDAMDALNFSGDASSVVIQRAYADTDTPPANITAEPKIWTGPLSQPDNSITVPGLSPWTSSHGVITGYSQFAESIETTSAIYYPYGESPPLVDGMGNPIKWQAAAELAFSGSVAWVDISTSGNPYDSANQLWVGLDFQSFTWDDIGLDGVSTGGAMIYVDAHSLITGTSNEGILGDFTLVTSTGDVTFKLYTSNFTFLSSVYSNLTLTPTEWWPYQAGNPPADVWDSATGMSL